MGNRPADKAGTWYTADPEHLASELDRYLNSVQVTGTLPLAAAIVPHAGLAYSGPVAAKAYAWIRATVPNVDTFVVFGAVHTCQLTTPAVWSTGCWQTPFGDIAVDEELATLFLEAGLGEANETPHRGDNAIELQTPFLRHCFPESRIVPVAVPPGDSAATVGAEAMQVAAGAGRKAVAIGSTDLTHYGHSFAFAPAGTGEEAVAWSKANDRRLLNAMIALDVEAIVPTARQDHSACGAGAAAAACAWARAAGCSKGQLLEHTTSYDVMPDGAAAHFVGYGAVVFPVD